MEQNIKDLKWLNKQLCNLKLMLMKEEKIRRVILENYG